jgi:hypothetical protein
VPEPVEGKEAEGVRPAKEFFGYFFAPKKVTEKELSLNKI